jgi:hypothetical protein
MKLTKGKINKIKGKRIQSKKRIGHKHKHLVKHGRGLSYRKKRHFNLKNQTLKRFGIEVGGAGGNETNKASTPTSVAPVASTDAPKLSTTVTVPIVSNVVSTNAPESSTTVPVISNVDSTNASTKSATTTVPVESNGVSADTSSKSSTTVPIVSDSTTTTNAVDTDLPVATNVTGPAIAIPVDREDQTVEYNNIYQAMHDANNRTPATTPATTLGVRPNVENASESTSTSPPVNTRRPPVNTRTPLNRNVPKSTNQGTMRRDLTAIQPVPIKSVTPAPKKAVTTTPPIIDNKITPTPVVVTPSTSVITPSTPKTIATIPATAPSNEKNQTPSTTPPQFVNLPDNFGPSTTMAELANYFSNVFLVQLMSKFDINTSMTLRDILLTMNKVNNNMGNNMGLNVNGMGNGNGGVNGNGAVMNNNTRTSKDLQKDLNVNIEPGIDNNGNIGQNQYSDNDTRNTGNDMGSGMGMGMGMGMNSGMGMGMSGSDMNNMGMGNEDNVTPKDTRSRLDIQNENADMDLQNNKISAENKELSESIAKHEAELKVLRDTPGSDPAKIKELETKILDHKNTITKNENVMTDNDRKKKANKSAEWKLKSYSEVASDIGSSAYGAAKSVGNTVGDAGSSAYTGVKNLVKGPDYDTINANREKLLDQQTVSNNKIAEIEKQIDKTSDPAIAEKLKTQRDTEKKNLEKYENKLNKNEELYQKNQTKLQDIKDQVSNKNEEHGIRSATHAVPKIVEPHVEGHGARIASHEGEHGSPSIRTHMSNAVGHMKNMNPFRKKIGGKKTRKLQKR